MNVPEEADAKKVALAVPSTSVVTGIVLPAKYRSTFVPPMGRAGSPRVLVSSIVAVKELYA